ncbi:transcriptional regulator with XRE-family HTH domain [Kibdelosporangium banguiense]|uniref:Transcriptional regulator with XRE-family HTH domain n=1 Tax=Kibdelosporangium banguiense TaxID=1365924 RepID=A0ABS4TPE8_9PSEU|nr:helix-turn-helix transcriptional regulator [Kibdelosporangium banguiense]MBP2326280.1 transcriptional regulator with XRE-family HTH domain [Kibdelosporangium banguiense]
MTEQTRPPFLRRKLGAKLRRLREQAGLTIEEAAPRLDKTKSALHRMETGETKADVHFVRSLMDIYDHYDPDLVKEARKALKPPWFRAFRIKDLGYVDIETEAAQVQECILASIPGLLQTKAYMQALFRDQGRLTESEAASHTEVRLIRQRRLIDEDRPLRLTAVIYEAALHREFGDCDVMSKQLRHLVRMSQLSTVTLQVLPLRSGARCALEGAFILVGFPDPEDPELLYVEYASGSMHIENPREVQEARIVFDQLRTDALSPAGSVALIERLITELYGP